MKNFLKTKDLRDKRECIEFNSIHTYLLHFLIIKSYCTSIFIIILSMNEWMNTYLIFFIKTSHCITVQIPKCWHKFHDDFCNFILPLKRFPNIFIRYDRKNKHIFPSNNFINFLLFFFSSSSYASSSVFNLFSNTNNGILHLNTMFTFPQCNWLYVFLFFTKIIKYLTCSVNKFQFKQHQIYIHI